jgi:lipid-binding SYLF domain-containing protein
MKNLMMSAVMMGMLAGCASAPETRPEQRALEANADGALERMVARDPTLNVVLANAAGYVVFPSVASGGLVVGAEGGVGVAYERNRPIGYSELRGASLGLQAGGQTYAQLVVFETPEALARFRTGNFDMSANLTATAINSGAGANVRFEDGVAVFIDDETGLMAGASLSGQNMSFTQNRPRVVPQGRR